MSGHNITIYHERHAKDCESVKQELPGTREFRRILCLRNISFSAKEVISINLKSSFLSLTHSKAHYSGFDRTNLIYFHCLCHWNVHVGQKQPQIWGHLGRFFHNSTVWCFVWSVGTTSCWTFSQQNVFFKKTSLQFLFQLSIVSY